MTNNFVLQVINLRFLVGFLGEKDQSNWWMSNFISRSSDAFLLPTYPRTTLLAQYHGVCEAALLVHEDNRISVGNTYHLYRLPNSIEREVAECIRDQSDSAALKNNISSKDTALATLSELSGTVLEAVQGPVAVGEFQDDELGSLLDICAAHYLNAFRQGYQCFPYMKNVA